MNEFDRNGSLQLDILRVNTRNVINIPGFPSSLPRQVLAGTSAGPDYLSHFFVKDGQVGYVNGRASGNPRPSLNSV